MARSTFVYATYIHTTPERLWSALTDAEEVAHWLVPEAAEHTVEYLEIRRPHRLSLTIRGSASAAMERVTVVIEPRGDGCLLTLTRIEPARLQALAPMAPLATYRAEKVARSHWSHWPTLEGKAALSLGLHLVMLPVLVTVLREPELSPGAGAGPSLAMMTVDLGTAKGAQFPEPSHTPAVVAPGQPALTPPTPPLGSPAARPAPRAIGGSTLPALPSRDTRPANHTAHNQGASANSRGTQALNSVAAAPRATNGPNLATSAGGATGNGDEMLRRQGRATGEADAPLIETTCIGAISFSPDVGTVEGGPGESFYGGQKVPVQAHFFRDQYEKPWLRFTFRSRAPVNLPVTIAGREIRWTGVYGSGYALLPAGNNHLAGHAGFTNDPAAKIDFICAGSDAHPA